MGCLKLDIVGTSGTIVFCTLKKTTCLESAKPAPPVIIVFFLVGLEAFVSVWKSKFFGKNNYSYVLILKQAGSWEKK